MEKTIMNIEGMHCGGCATGIQMVTEQMEGVTSSFVDLDGKQGTFEHDPDKVSADEIIAEIEKLGYKASVAS